MSTTETHEQLQARAREMRRMAAKSPFKSDRERFTALALGYEQRSLERSPGQSIHPMG